MAQRSFFLRASFALCIAAVLAGCGGFSAAGRRAHVLRIAYSGDPATLDPLIASDQTIIAYNLLFCQTLVGLSADNRIVPILVTRVPTRENGDISRDGKRITYHLRPVRFADGRPFTSADVAFTYRALLDPRNRTISDQPYRRIESLRTPDAHTVVITVRRPWNAAVRVLFAQADYAFGILPQHAFADTKVVETPWEQAPFGTGPFRVTQWNRGDRVVLEPNPYYSPKPKLQRIELRVIPNLNSEFVALQTGAVDLATLTADNVERAAHLRGVQVLRIPENGNELLYLQTQLAPTDDLHVRRAIAYALDHDALSNAWHHEFPTVASFLPPPIVRWKHQDLKPYPHDLAAVNRELDAAGWRMVDGERRRDGHPLNMVLGTNADDPINVRAATLIQSQLAAAGMHVSIKPYTTNIWFSLEGPLRSGRAAMMGESWIGGSDPEQSVNLLCSEAVNGGDNHSRYCSHELDALFEDQARVPIEKQRYADFDGMERLVYRDVPEVPLYNEIYFEGLNDRVTGYAKNMLRFPVSPENWDVR